jgi:alpha-glucosidase
MTRRATLSNPPRFTLAEQAPGRLTLTADSGAAAHVFVLEEDIVRLLVLPGGTVTSPPSWAICPGGEDIADPGRDRMDVSGFACPAFALAEADGTLTIETTRLRLTIALHGLHCSWAQRAGAAWVEIARDRRTQAYDFGWFDGRPCHYLERLPGERYYGLGERSGPMDRSGRRLRLVNLDPMGYDAAASDPLYKSIPYILVADAANRCHGAFYDTLAQATFDFGLEHDNYHPHYRYMQAEHGDIDLWMIAGPDPLGVTKRFTWLTGRPALMPEYALGYSGSTMSYTDAPDAASQMAGFLEKLEEHDIGCSSFHLSSGYTSIGDKRYVFHWNTDKFPDPAGFIASYAAAGVRLVPNIKPALLIDHPWVGGAKHAGLLIADEDGEPVEAQFWDFPGHYLDFTNPSAARWWQNRLTETLLSQGIIATWNDNNEYGVWDSRARVAGFGSPRAAAEMLPAQTQLMIRASRAAQIAAQKAGHGPDEAPYVVTRSGMAGLQRYAQSWSGDNRTAWPTLRYNLKMGLGLALSGMSNTGHDVGGFSGPKPDPELFLRWIQAGVLMPRFSIHSWNDDRTVNEPWMYPEVLPAVRRLMALRQTLLPFFYDLLARYHRDYEPMIRPLWLQFPEDAGAWHDGDDHLLGREVLAALVVEPGAETRQVRLPGRDDWYHVWSGERFAGGSEIEVAATLDGPPPLFARAGSGMLVDLAKGGFRPEPRRYGVWLFPPAEGAIDWSARGEAYAEPWTIAGTATAEAVEITVAGPAPLTVILPEGDKRRLTIKR